ncbi:MAG: hypothetical protein IT236_15305, partial [Bacteroidia bacterium]|nr:hypothetical protein [Bacteroidia bacterium]
MSFFLRETGVSYQFNRIDTWEDRLDLKTKLNYKIPRQVSMYRIDLKWVGANLNNKIETGEPVHGFNNYYLQNCPNGINGVKTFKDLTYKNIYRNIDLHYYEKNGNLKYDYIINATTDYKQIRIRVEGADKIEIQKDGSIILNTEFGQITEDAPYAEQAGQKIEAYWKVDGNILSFELGNYNPNLPIILDPLI